MVHSATENWTMFFSLLRLVYDGIMDKVEFEIKKRNHLRAHEGLDEFMYL